MITTQGKGLLARALAGQIPAAFSYIALGVGAKPDVPVTVVEKPKAAWGASEVLDDGVWGLETDTLLAKLGDGATQWSSLDYQSTGVLYEDNDIKERTNLIFEAFRIPVTGASVVFERGQTKVMLTGVLPSAQRYEFSEIGVFSSESNSLLTTETPKMIYTFSDSEGWEHHAGSTITDIEYGGSVSSNGFDIDVFDNINPKAFFVSADNPVFFPVNRKNQRMRIYQDALLLRGDISVVDDSSSTWALSGEHVHLSGKSVNLTRARPDDELKIAFAIMNTVYSDITAAGVANEVRVAVRFMSAENSSAHATLQAKVVDGATSNSQFPHEADFLNNGYYVVSFTKKDLVYTANFSWDNVVIAQVFVEVEPGISGQVSSDYYVAVDAIRFDSNNNNNPSYGLTAYSAIRNSQGATESKPEQSESQVEYKVILEV